MTTSASNLPDMYRAALFAFGEMARRATVPLIHSQGELAAIWGSGTLFEVRGRHYLVTAHHVAEGPESGDIGIPLGRHRAAVRKVAFGQFLANKRYDVAVLPIEESDAASLVSFGWEFLTLDYVSGEPPPPGSAYVVYGYPSASLQQDGDFISVAPLAYLANPYTGPLEGFRDPYESTVDFLLQHTVRALNFAGQLGDAPAFHGISGGSVWAIPDPSATSEQVWSSHKNARIVGIETSYLRDSWIRCRDWAVVRALIEESQATTPRME